MATLAEQLGFAATDRVAIVHADDIGMCNAANQGAFQTLLEGSVSCGSIMVPCPWFSEAAALARAHPELDLGVHLTLNSEFDAYRWGPVAGSGTVPSLVDDEGCLWRTSLEVVQNAKPEEVELELRAQIDRALAAGIDVTHLDAHMGTVMFPPLHEIYARLAADYRLPAFAAWPDDASLELAGLAGAAGLLRRLCERFAGDGFPVLDGLDLDSLSFADGDGRAHNRRRLAGLGRGVSYLIVHPARDGEEIRRITPEQAAQRAFEHAFYGGAEGAEALAAEGIRSVGMRPLRALLRRG